MCFFQKSISAGIESFSFRQLLHFYDSKMSKQQLRYNIKKNNKKKYSKGANNNYNIKLNLFYCRQQTPSFCFFSLNHSASLDFHSPLSTFYFPSHSLAFTCCHNLSECPKKYALGIIKAETGPGRGRERGGERTGKPKMDTWPQVLFTTTMLAHIHTFIPGKRGKHIKHNCKLTFF